MLSYAPLKSEATKEATVKDSIKTVSLEKLDQVKGRDLKEFHEERLEYILDGIKSDHYLFDDLYYDYLKATYDQIKRANGQIEHKAIEVLVGRSKIPNAYCYGNGVLVVNLGLISRMQNQDQLAFVICHELAHQFLEHVNKKVEKRIEKTNSRAYKKKLKKLKKEEYSRLDKLEQFYLDQALKSRQYSRIRELEADSMAIELLKNTDFDLNEALSALEMLDHIDEAKYKDTIAFNSHFSIGDFRFQNKWLVKRDGLEVEQKLEQELIDSLKTHPDCKERIIKLVDNFNLSPLALNDTASDFINMSQRADFEIIHQPEQETNDLEKALSLALQKGASTCHVLGGFGKRMDHSLKNLSVMKKFDGLFDTLIYRDETFDAFIVDGHFSGKLPVGSIVSLYPLSGEVKGIKTEGLKYPLNSESLKNGARDGTSNETSRSEFSIEVEEGDLVAFIQRR
jgi:thiamine pyrophosphokinase